MVCDETTAEKLVSWFVTHQRRMPWRDDPTPYHVWVSEIMLQQTRVDTVIPYYLRFVEELPDVNALASCSEDRLNKLWEGLGYYTRVRNLQKAARICTEQYGGDVPGTYEALIKLPGIGTYTAGAILSIAFHKRYPVVDGNVLRVLSRLTGSMEDIKDPAVKARMEEELQAFLSGTDLDPSAFNQGLMELGAIVCLPNGEPKCAVCPWLDTCFACLHGMTGVIPVAKPKNTSKTVPMTVLILQYGKRIGLEKRPGKGLLSGLYGLPAVDGRLTEEEAEAALRARDIRYSGIRRLPDARHVFTHRIWEMSAYLVLLDEMPPGLQFASLSDLQDRYALPSAFKKWNFEEWIGS